MPDPVTVSGVLTAALPMFQIDRATRDVHQPAVGEIEIAIGIPGVNALPSVAASVPALFLMVPVALLVNAVVYEVL